MAVEGTYVLADYFLGLAREGGLEECVEDADDLGRLGPLISGSEPRCIRSVRLRMTMASKSG